MPGAFDGWVTLLERFGTMKLADLLAPVGACKVLKGPQANRAAVVEALSSGQYRVVHFAGPVRPTNHQQGTLLVVGP